MKNEMIFCTLLAASTLCSSCMNGGKGERQVTPAIDSIGDTLANSGLQVPESDSLSKEDRTFILAVSTGSIMEIEAGKLAESKSKNPEIKSFASTMIKDHGKASAELTAIVKKLGITPSDTLTTEQSAHLRKLKTLNDLAFDKQYMTMMIADHANTVRLFDDGTRLPNADLKAFAGKTIPVIRTHRVMAIAIGKTLNLKNVNTGDDLIGESPAPGHTN
jgi:putative membrane protein